MKKVVYFMLFIVFAFSLNMPLALSQDLQIQDNVPNEPKTKELKIQYDVQYDTNNDIPVANKTVLTGGVSHLQGLPTGMYGIWQVKGVLIDSNDYSKYVSNSSDIWVLKKEGNYVTLMNPQNGATATITVTNVSDNTATFVRGLKSNNRKDSEKVTITLKGDTFFGTDLIVNETIAYGISMTTVARYRINGVRISGDSLYKANSPVKLKF